MPHIQSKRLNVLGTGGAKRTVALPNVPTIAEAGVPGYEANNWWGIMAPAGTPGAIVKRLHTEIAEILKSPAIQKKFETQGADTVSMSSAEFAKFIQAETRKWGKVVKDAGIKAE